MGLYPELEKSKELGEEDANKPPSYSKMSELEDVFGEAYACIEQGLCYDDVNHREEAVSMYERGLALLAEGSTMEGASGCELYGYLKEAEKSVTIRIGVLKKELANPAQSSSKASEMKKSTTRDELLAIGGEEAELVLAIPGVQLFSIDEASTEAPTYPTDLCLFKFPPREPAPSSSSAPPAFSSIRPDAFLQVGPWSYPLYKEQTPVLVNEFGAYVVSNPTPDRPDLSVAIILPADVDPSLKEKLHAAFKEYAVLRESQEHLGKEEKKKVCDRLARFLIKGGEKAAWCVHKGSTKAASFAEQHSQKYRNGVPTDKPVTVSPVVKSGAVYVHKGSKVVAKCTRYLLDRIGDVGVAVGRRVAAGARNSFGDGKAGGVVSGTITVLGGGIAGVSTVWIALEDASKTLCNSIANQTVDVVKVKYGDDAATTTHHALRGVGHTTLAATQLWDLGPRSIAGRMARKAGIQVVRDLDPAKKYEKKEEKVPDEKNEKSKKK